MIEKTFPLIEKQILNLLTAAEQLHQQLNQEADHLKQPQQAELVSHIASNKSQLVVRTEQLSKQLGDLLAIEQLPYSQEGIQAVFQRAETAGFSTLETTRNWAQLRSLSEACRALNEHNGACIELLARRTQQSLHILKGKPQLANTYGPDGITKSDYFSHTLISV
ncbi:MAG: flagella synthesis protein FlgN [Methylosarcina sp.]